MEVFNSTSKLHVQSISTFDLVYWINDIGDLGFPAKSFIALAVKQIGLGYIVPNR